MPDALPIHVYHIPDVCSRVVKADMYCPDLVRDPQNNGGWVLSGDLEDRPGELQAQNPDLRIAQCFEQLGAVWNPTLYVREDEPDMCYIDPVETRRTHAHDATDFRGAWMLKQSRLGEVHRLKAEHGDWAWRRCFEEAGARWMAGYWMSVLDEEAVPEERMFAHLVPRAGS